MSYKPTAQEIINRGDKTMITAFDATFNTFTLHFEGAALVYITEQRAQGERTTLIDDCTLGAWLVALLNALNDSELSAEERVNVRVQVVEHLTSKELMSALKCELTSELDHLASYATRYGVSRDEEIQETRDKARTFGLFI